MKLKKNFLFKFMFGALSVFSAALLCSTIVLAVLFANLKDDNNNLNNRVEVLENASTEVYDFYMTYGTMPTLYATLSAYQNKNPNTYMWFYRGNTISYDYSADFIHYFNSQSKTNASSTIDYMEIRLKVYDILQKNPSAKFRLYCDDLRVRYILDVFVAAGVDFEDMQVTLLSDGTATYELYSSMTEERYLKTKTQWAEYLEKYVKNRDDLEYTQFIAGFNNNGGDMQDYLFYISTFENVNYWVQHPDYLINEKSASINADRYNMNIIKKDPKALYMTMDEKTRLEYQRVVLANALVDSDTLLTLDDAVEYFDSNLKDRDKDVVLIIGNKYNGLEHNQSFINQTIEFYTPTRTGENTVVFKNQIYNVSADDTMIEIEGKMYLIGECSVYLFFKGHPSYPANGALLNYFNENNIVVLPHRTPVETLFWMYDVLVGGYESTAFLSCELGQTEFFYGNPVLDAILQMQQNGFFDNAVVFSE